MIVKEPVSRVDALLHQWAEWMRRGNNVARGFPFKSAGIVEVGICSFDDMEYSSNAVLARAVDTIVNDLPDMEKNAIGHYYLDNKYMHPIITYEASLNNAMELVELGCDKKGIY